MVISGGKTRKNSRIDLVRQMVLAVIRPNITNTNQERETFALNTRTKERESERYKTYLQDKIKNTT